MNNEKRENRDEIVQRRILVAEKKRRNLEGKIEKIIERKKKIYRKAREKHDIYFGRSFGWVFLCLFLFITCTFFGTGYSIITYSALALDLITVLSFFLFRHFYSKKRTKRDIQKEVAECEVVKGRLERMLSYIDNKEKKA